MSRSVLRVRQEPHLHPDRREETVVEVVRNGEVVATIYGSEEGVHITSGRLSASTPNTAFRLSGLANGLVIPLLARGEPCPWCQGKKLVRGEGEIGLCPVCQSDVTDYRV